MVTLQQHKSEATTFVLTRKGFEGSNVILNYFLSVEKLN